MRRASGYTLLGPALLLYLVADASAALGQLDLPGALVALLAGVLSLTPIAAARTAEHAGAHRVAWLGLFSASALVRLAAPAAMSLVAELSHVLALAGAAALVVDLALSVPDRLPSARGVRLLRVACYCAGALVGLVGASAYLPEMRLAGAPYVAPAWVAHVPRAALGTAVVVALALRLWRRRLGSSPEALASNAWAIFGLVPAVLAALVCAAFALARSGEEPALRIGVAIAACALAFGQLRMLDPSRRLGVGRATRNGVAAVATLVAVAAASVALRPLWPEGMLALGAASAVAMLCALALYRGLCELARVLLAPASGRLLAALDRAHAELAEARDLLQVGKVALGAARRASGRRDTEPYLYMIDPPCELRIDAAGVAHAEPRPVSPEIARALRERPGQLVLRAPLEAQMVRTPGLRPLYEVLCALDAACVLPLSQYGELEGALLFPRGARRSSYTLEEIEALHAFGRHLSGFVCVLASEARAARRAAHAFAASEAAAAHAASAHRELGRTQAELRALRSGGALERLQGRAVAYSEPMRALLRRVQNVAREVGPIAIVAERGLPPAPIARELHAQSARAAEPFVVAECAGVRPEELAGALFGRAGAPGWLEIAGNGTLLLCDLPALGGELQRALAAALRARRAEPVGGGDAYPCGARLVASCRREPDELVDAGALAIELRALFVAVLRVPPLRDRVEDVSSLVLLALAQAARVLGRPPIGIDSAAQARLLAYGWPGNLDELYAVVELAVARSRGPRVTAADLPAFGPGAAQESPLDGTLERVERRVLARALERTDGNKSEAARLLGLKRTTFLDKLRRHGLDDSPDKGSTPPN